MNKEEFKNLIKKDRYMWIIGTISLISNMILCGIEIYFNDNYNNIFAVCMFVTALSIIIYSFNFKNTVENYKKCINTT